MSDSYWEEWRRHLAATESEELIRSLSDEQLKEHLQYFKAARQHGQIKSSDLTSQPCNERIELLRAEMGQRRTERLLKWIGIPTLIASIAAVVVPLMVHDCSRSSPTPSEARPTPTPTPQQSPTETPSQ